MSIPQTLGLAWQHYEAGRLSQAEILCRQIVQAHDGHSGALHLLGMIASRSRRGDQAVDFFQAALRLDPDFADAWIDLAIELTILGKRAEAVDAFRQALRVKPDDARAHYSLGVAWQLQGKHDEATASFQKAAQLKPEHADAHCRLGHALLHHGKLEQAIVSLRQALTLKPSFPEAHHALGTAFMTLGRLDEAVTHFQDAIRQRPSYASAHLDLGNAFQQQGRLNEAVTSYTQATRVRPDYPEAYSNLGNALLELGQPERAIECLQQALRLRPDFVEAAYNLGLVLWTQGRPEEAANHYRRAIELEPRHSCAYLNLGNCLKDQGQLDEAIAAYRAAIELEPATASFHSTLILATNYHPRLDQKALHEETRRWNQRHAAPLQKAFQPHSNPRDPDRRLRIGYVSPDFHEHPASSFTVPLLSHHDHDQFEIFCYAQVERPDAFTERLRGYSDHWRSTVGLADEQLADMIRRDRIDILVDLALHTANSRLLVFARKPAPVQITWLGYPGTTGLSTIDYRLTDPYLDPPGLIDAYYSEQSVRLPETFWCYDPVTETPSVNALPAENTGAITFGCLNNFCKVNDGVLSLWAKVLHAVPRLRLLLRAPRGQARDHVTAVLGHEGIVATRLEFVDRRSRQEYFRLFHRIDLCLDPFPCSGGTTTLNAFWMGVPTVTLIGKTVVGRAGWSQLCNLDLKDLAAESPEQYVAIAAELAGNLPRLVQLRRELRERMLASPLADAPRFARNLEHVYRRVWRRWCELPDSG